MRRRASPEGGSAPRMKALCGHPTLRGSCSTDGRELREGTVEDRDNGLDIHGVGDATLGGYFEAHDRPPAFEGKDGSPYTVSIEVDQVGDLLKPFVGYLVFPRWADTGLGIVGHLETPVLLAGRGSDEIRGHLERLTLAEVKSLLDETIDRQREEQI
jgi:hypothetical protein